MSQSNTGAARVVLAADALACAAGAVVLATAPGVDDLVDLGGGNRRTVVVGALTLTAGVLAVGAVRPTPARLTTAAVANAGWVVAGLAALPSRRDRLDVGIVAAVVGGDALAGALQWRLRRRV